MGLQTMPLKFRVWDSCADGWVRPYGREDLPHDKPYIYPLGNMLQRLGKTINWLDGERFIISQDTGIKADGVSVFTGDILQDDEGYLWIVQYINGGCAAVDSQEHNVIENLYLVARDSQVMGNIWQNPELL